jgi:predicted nucleic acid-binding protein
MPVRLYFDACCLNRLTDDQSQMRIRDEAAAVEGILRLVRDGEVIWVGSLTLGAEINRNPDAERRRDAAALLEFANEIVAPGPETVRRSTYFETLGFSPFDALHLASAEQGGAEVFLTTDDALLRRAGRHRNQLRVTVDNPVFWYRKRNS